MGRGGFAGYYFLDRPGDNMNSSPIGQEERKRLNFCSFMMLPNEPGLVESIDWYPSGYLTRFHLIAQSTVVDRVKPSITQAGALSRKHQR